MISMRRYPRIMVLWALSIVASMATTAQAGMAQFSGSAEIQFSATGKTTGTLLTPTSLGVSQASDPFGLTSRSGDGTGTGTSNLPKAIDFVGTYGSISGLVTATNGSAVYNASSNGTLTATFTNNTGMAQIFTVTTDITANLTASADPNGAAFASFKWTLSGDNTTISGSFSTQNPQSGPPYHVDPHFDVNVASGNTFTVQILGGALSGQASIASTPEPATFVMMGTGMVGMLALGWRHRRRVE